MRLAVVGSRDFSDYRLMKQEIDSLINRENLKQERTLLSGGSSDPFNIDVIVSGGAKGADTLAIRYATKHSIQTVVYPVTSSDWATYGKYAGPRRNEIIVDNSDVIIAFWDGKSSGTRSTINIAEKKGKICYIVYY